MTADRLATRFRRWAVAHLLLFLLAGSVALLLAQYAPPGPAKPTREVFVSLPAGASLSVNGRPTAPVTLPERSGQSGGAFLRARLPVGPLRLGLVLPDGTRQDIALELTSGERLLLITLTGDPARPLLLYPNR